MLGVRYPPLGGIRPRYIVISLVANMPLLTNLADHLSSSVHRCEVFTHSCMSLYLMSSMIFLLLTLFPRILCRSLTLGALAEAGGQASTGFWMVLVGSIVTF